MDLKVLIVPVGIVRILEVVLSCVSFSLVAAVGHSSHSFWVWCMFVWCFCFVVTLLIIVLEVTGLSEKMHISWGDFTAAFGMLAMFMVLSASIIYPVYFACSSCHRQIAASVTSCLVFLLYTVELVLTLAKNSEQSPYMSTVPGVLKVLEIFVACIIFICLQGTHFSSHAGPQWCVAVYSICFIGAVLVLFFAIVGLLTHFPAAVHKALAFWNVLAVLVYLTAVVIWPYYTLRGFPRPHFCHRFCPVWDNLVVISFMTCFNCVVYVADAACSVKKELL